jgi:hypothetical protein
VNVKALLSIGAIAVTSTWLTGCGMSNPRIAYVKAPVDPCSADCATLEVPAPNHDDMFNPASPGAGATVMLDGKPVETAFVMAYQGRVWYVVRVKPGKHSVKVAPRNTTGLVGAIATTAAAADLSFDAQPGKRYWLYNRMGVGGFSAKTWIEESSGDRAVVAGERNLEPHSIAASLLGDSEDKAAKSMVEVWWAGVPTYDKQFVEGAEKIGNDAPGGPAPAAKPADKPTDAAK